LEGIVMSEEKKSSLGWILLVVVLVGVVGYLLMTRDDKKGPDPDDPEPGTPTSDNSTPPADLVQLQGEARALQVERDFCAAEQKWQAVLAHGSIDQFPAIEQTAQMNLKTSTEGCKPAEPPVAQGQAIELPAQAEGETGGQEQANVLTADAMQAYYPEGRKIGSTAVTLIKGRGKNKKFILFNFDCFFEFQYELSLVTRVTENKPKLKKIVFEQEILKVTELLASSKTRFAGLSLPESPLAKLAWERGRILLLDPVTSGVVGTLVELIRSNAETINNVANQVLQSLPQEWQDRLDTKDPDMQALLDIGKLQGLVLEFTYYADMGVKGVKVIKGDAPSRSLLEQYARKTHLVADHYMARVEALKEGESMSLDVKAISNMIQIDPNVEVSGELQVRKAKATGDAHVLEIVGGTVYGTADDEGTIHRGRVQPKSGQIVYRPDEKMVTEATIAWKGTKEFVEFPGTFLFETSGAKNLEATSRYTAELAPDSK
jgi:hypothetical protein